MTTPTTPAPAESVWHRYQRQGVIEARAWTQADVDDYFALSRIGDRPRISISQSDEITALNPVGFVARNPDNHADQWYIAPDYFAKHYAPVTTPATDVKRYDIETRAPDYTDMFERDHGEYVKYTAYAALAAELTRTQQELRKAEADLDAATAEVWRLRADANRYRWLRAGDNDELVLRVWSEGDEPGSRLFDARFDSCYLPRDEKLDAAIDSAMSLAPSPTNSDEANSEGK